MSRITEVYVTSLRIPLKRPHNTALGPTTHQENTLVKMITDDGLEGWGEVPFGKGHNQRGETSGTARSVLRDRLIPALLGRDPLRIEENQRLLDRVLPGNFRAKSALNVASYDLAGRILHTPVYNLVGGLYRESLLLSWSIPFLEEEAAIQEVQERIGLGWRLLKVKLGRGNWKEDVRMVARIRTAAGPHVRLRTDANQAYDVSTAIRVGHALAEQDVEYFEQPVARWDLEGMARVRQAIEIPVMADESVKTAQDLIEMVRLKAADFVAIYMSDGGGITNGKAMAAIAEAANVRCYIGGAYESAVGVAAALHLGAASPAINLGCEQFGQFLMERDVSILPFRFAEGALWVPHGPGLGVEIDSEAILRYKWGEDEIFRAGH